MADLMYNYGLLEEDTACTLCGREEDSLAHLLSFPTARLALSFLSDNAVDRSGFDGLQLLESSPAHDDLLLRIPCHDKILLLQRIVFSYSVWLTRRELLHVPYGPRARSEADINHNIFWACAPYAEVRLLGLTKQCERLLPENRADTACLTANEML